MNPASGLKTGSRIRVVLEGYYVPAAMPENLDNHFYIRPERHPGKESSRISTGSTLKDLELLDEPLKDGGVYRCAEGYYWEYSARTNTWLVMGDSSTHDFNEPKRPLQEMP